jgi:hypothetical protein
MDGDEAKAIDMRNERAVGEYIGYYCRLDGSVT